MGLNDRLDKLERHQPPEQCPKCRDQQYGVYVKGEPRPSPCSKCGKMPGFVIEANSTAGHDMVLRLISGELPKPWIDEPKENDEKEGMN